MVSVNPSSSNRSRLSTYAALAAATTAVPVTSQAAVVWSGNNGFMPITLPVGGQASVTFPTHGQVFAFSNYPRSIITITGYAGTSSSATPIYDLVRTNSAVVQRLINTASVVVNGNDPIRLSYSQFPVVDGGEGGAHWSNVDPANTGSTSQDIGGNTGSWNGSGVQTGYMLFRFDPDGGADSFLYGWFDLSYNNDTDDLIINGWAFDDSGEILGAGHGVGEPIPEASTLVPAGLFALAAGAAGLRRRRAAQRQAAAAAQN